MQIATPVSGGGVCCWLNTTSMLSPPRRACGKLSKQAGARAVWSRPGRLPAPLGTWPASRPHARGGLCTVVRHKLWTRAMADVATPLPWAVLQRRRHTMAPPTSYVRWFEELRAEDVAQVGGKN